MKIKTTAAAGTLESSDVYVTAAPNEKGGRDIHIESPVLRLYEEQMLKVIGDALDQLEVKDVILTCKDRGAIDCVFRARVMAAVCRASGESFDWSLEDKEA